MKSVKHASVRLYPVGSSFGKYLNSFDYAADRRGMGNEAAVQRRQRIALFCNGRFQSGLQIPYENEVGRLLRRQGAYKECCLPTRVRGLCFAHLFVLVGFTTIGATGFEPAASWSQTRRSTKLSYAPWRCFTAGMLPGCDHIATRKRFTLVCVVLICWYLERPVLRRLRRRCFRGAFPGFQFRGAVRFPACVRLRHRVLVRFVE